jgi:hypothetical protein
MNVSSSSGSPRAPVQQTKPRCGCFPVVIGALLNHKLDANLTLPSGRFLRAGQSLHLTVEDITRHPELEQHTKWICRSPLCTGKHWKTKKALVAEHRPNKELDRDDEVHCFYAVASVPGVEPKAEVRAKDGSIVSEAVESKMPSILLLSDEE